MRSRLPATVLRAGAYLSSGILLGRMVGFVREALIARNYGTSTSADLAVLMLTVPDLLVSILVGGALSVAFIPEIKRLDPRSAAQLFWQANGIVLAISAGITCLLVLASLPLVRILVPGFQGDTLLLAATSLRWVLWVIPLTVLAGLTTAFAQAYDRFAIPALGTAIINGVLVVGLWWGGQGLGLLTLAMLILAGAALRWISQLLALPRFITARPDSWNKSLLNRRLLKGYLQALTVSGMLMVFPVVARAIASFDATGSVAILNYASKLIELPLGACVSVLSIALFPRLALIHQQGDVETYCNTVVSGIRLVLTIAFSLILPMAWFRYELAGLALGRGRMSEPSLGMVAELALVGLLSVPAQGITSILVAAFNARRDMKAPMVASFLGLLLFAVLGTTLRSRLGLLGVMIALTIVNWLLPGLLAVFFRKGHGIDLTKALMELATVKPLLLVALTFVPIAMVSMFVSGRLIGGGLAVLGSACCLAVGLYFQGGALLLKRLGRNAV